MIREIEIEIEIEADFCQIDTWDLGTFICGLASDAEAVVGRDPAAPVAEAEGQRGAGPDVEPRRALLRPAPGAGAGGQLGLSEPSERALDPGLPVGERGGELAADIASLKVKLSPGPEGQPDRRELGHGIGRRPEPGAAVGLPRPGLGGDPQRHAGQRAGGQARRNFPVPGAGQRRARAQIGQRATRARRREAVL